MAKQQFQLFHRVADRYSTNKEYGMKDLNSKAFVRFYMSLMAGGSRDLSQTTDANLKEIEHFSRMLYEVQHGRWVLVENDNQ